MNQQWENAKVAFRMMFNDFNGGLKGAWAMADQTLCSLNWEPTLEPTNEVLMRMVTRLIRDDGHSAVVLASEVWLRDLRSGQRTGEAVMLARFTWFGQSHKAQARIDRRGQVATLGPWEEAPVHAFARSWH
jgi:hypothetical protein